MSQTPKKQVREKSKTRAWEKERRNRLNDYFNKLWEVLPIYESSKPISKPDILIHAASTVKDLQEKLRKLLVDTVDKKPSEERFKVSSDIIKKLEDRVKKLLVRNEQLTKLLSTAGIKVPSECGAVKKFRKTPKYANNITAEQQEKILHKNLEKENQVKQSKPKISRSRVNIKKPLKKLKNKKPRKVLFSSSNCVFVVSQPTVQNNPCFILSSKATAKVNQTVITNSLLVKAPIVSSTIKSSIFPSFPQLPGLGTGTLLFADSTMMPFVSNPRPLPVLSTILSNPVPAELSSAIVVSSKNNVNLLCADKITTVSSDTKILLKGSSRNLNTSLSQNYLRNLPVLKPRSNITKTTQVNKVPIPALSSRFNKHACMDTKKAVSQGKKVVQNRLETTHCKSLTNKKRTPELAENEAKKQKTRSNDILKRDNEIGSIPLNEKTPSSTFQSVETPAYTNKDKNIKILEQKKISQPCKETASISNPQVLNDLASACQIQVTLSEVLQSTVKVLESQAGSSSQTSTIQRFSDESFVNSGNEKVAKSHEITSFICDAPAAKNVPATRDTESKQIKESVGINKDAFKSSTNLPSNNFELETFKNMPDHCDSLKQQIGSSTTKNDSIDNLKQLDANPLNSENCAAVVNANTNDSLNTNSASSKSLTRNDDSIIVKHLQTDMHQKSYASASSCLKQGSKTFNLSGLQAAVDAENGNINDLKSLEMNLIQTPQADLSNDIFASFQVPLGCQNPESTSPTAAFLLAFPLVSSGVKVAEVMGDENSQSQAGTPNLLQIGTMDISKPTQSYSESLTPNLLNFDNFSFFNNKDNSGSFYNNCNMINTSSQPNNPSVVTSKAISSFANNIVVQHLNPVESSSKTSFANNIAAQHLHPVDSGSKTDASFAHNIAAQHLHPVGSISKADVSYAPNIAPRHLHPVDSCSKTVTSFAHNIAAQHSHSVDPSSKTVTSFAHNVAAQHLHPVDPSSKTVTSFAHNIAAQHSHSVDPSSRTVTSFAHNVAAQHLHPVDPSSKTVTSFAHNIAAQHLHSVDPSSKTVTSFAHNVAAQHLHPVDPSSKTVTSFAHNIAAQHLQPVESGSKTDASFANNIATQHLHPVDSSSKTVSSFVPNIASQHLHPVDSSSKTVASFAQNIVVQHLNSVDPSSKTVTSFPQNIVAQHLHPLDSSSKSSKTVTSFEHNIAAQHLHPIDSSSKTVTSFAHNIAAQHLQPVDSSSKTVTSFAQNIVNQHLHPVDSSSKSLKTVTSFAHNIVDQHLNPVESGSKTVTSFPHNIAAQHFHHVDSSSKPVTTFRHSNVSQHLNPVESGSKTVTSFAHNIAAQHFHHVDSSSKTVTSFAHNNVIQHLSPVESSSKINTIFANNNVVQQMNPVDSSSKTCASFTHNTVVQHLNPVEVAIKNDQATAITELKVNYNKSDVVTNRSANHTNIIGNNNKEAAPVKVPNYHDSIRTLQNAAQAVKEQPINNPAQNVEKTLDNSRLNSNVSNINSDVFSFKPVLNESYLHLNKYSNNTNAAVPTYTSKTSGQMSNYSNYKNYNSSISNHQFGTNKHYPPVYTSANISNTFHNSFGTEGDGRNYNMANCNNYTEYNRKNFTNSYNANSQMYESKEKANLNMQAKAKPAQNKPINWMTTPSTTASYKPDYFLPPFSKEAAFNSNMVVPSTSYNTLPSNTYFNSSVYNYNDHLNITQDFRKTADVPLPNYSTHQRTETEENQFSWSPNKMPQFLDTAHAHSFVSSTLPTLVGDLALNTTPMLDQKNLKDRNRDTVRRKSGNYDNQTGQSSFLSVSQLVEQTQENVPAKVVSRRTSGNRSKTNTPKSKRVSGRQEPNKELQNYQKNEKSNFNISVATNLFHDSKQEQSRNTVKNVSSIYSAEALIGNQGSTETVSKRNNCQDKSIIPSFCNENMVSYFPPIEVSQENNYIHSSQSYHANSYSQNLTTTYPNSSYATNNFAPSSCPITSSYIQTNTFMSNTNSQDFLGETTNLFQSSTGAVAKERCNFAKNYYRSSEKEDKNQSYSCKKAKKRPLNDNVLPSFDMHFFSMPGAINSPILPDDFHTTYLPPTTLYSCKNPLYSKPNSETIPSSLIPPLPAISGNKPAVQHPQMSPSVISSGTSLTNFNLSTIFPEINKGPVQDTFSDNRNKDYNSVSKSYSTSSRQVPFSNKSSIIF